MKKLAIVGVIITNRTIVPEVQSVLSDFGDIIMGKRYQRHSFNSRRRQRTTFGFDGQIGQNRFRFRKIGGYCGRDQIRFHAYNYI